MSFMSTRALVFLAFPTLCACGDAPPPPARHGRVISAEEGKAEMAVGALPFEQCTAAADQSIEMTFALSFGADGRLTAASAETKHETRPDPALHECILSTLNGATVQAGPPFTTTITFRAWGTPDGHLGRPFDRGAAAATIGGVHYRDCLPAAERGDTQLGHIQITFAPTGMVQTAVVDVPPLAGTPLAACIEERFKAIRVPPFTGSAVKVGKSFSF